MKGYSCIGLHQPKTHHNIGGVLRIAGNFNSKFVAISGKRYNRQATDSMKYYRHYPVLHNLENLYNVIPFDCVPIAVDLLDDAYPLNEFKHPRRSFYIFGPEDGTLGKDITNFCKEKIYVPTNHCMNLAVTVGIVLYDRLIKEESLK